MKKLLVIFFSLFQLFLFGQKDSYIDSLELLLRKEISDSLRASVYIDLAEYINEEKIWMDYNGEAMKLADKGLRESKGAVKKYYYLIKAHATGNLGYYYDFHGKKQKSFEHYFKALELYDKAGAFDGKAAIFSNLGVMYTNQGDFEEAEDYLFKALKLKKKYAPKDVAKNYINLGVLYDHKKDSLKALDYYHKGFDAASEINDHEDMATALNNIGSYYYQFGQYQIAIPYLAKAVGECYLSEDEIGAAWIMSNLGNSYVNAGRLDSADFFLQKAKEISLNYDYPDLKHTVAEKLFNLYQVRGEYKNALEQYMYATRLNDSINNISAQKEAIRQKLNYDYGMEKAKIQLQREEERKRARQRTIFISTALVLILITAIVMYSRFKLAKRQKKVIEGQKLLVEEKNKEITDSINYAKYLQGAILPDKQLLFKGFDDGFLIYLPKDIVAGDFYWCHESPNYRYIAVADCTGHGVPGAMVSVVCANALEKAVHDEESEPGVLLNRVRELVIAQFSGEDQDVKDGMDLALLRISIHSKEIEFAGANNPCWLRRGEKWKIFKGDRQPVGKYDHSSEFNTTRIDGEAGDWIYLFTDGIVDQFGGKEGKKLRSQGLQHFLSQLNGIDKSTKEEALIAFVSEWRGDLDQIDDICLLGIKL